jgi:hypothetical protein
MMSSWDQLSLRHLYLSIGVIFTLNMLTLVSSKNNDDLDLAAYILDPHKVSETSRHETTMPSSANYEYHHTRDDYEYHYKKQQTSTYTKSVPSMLNSMKLASFLPDPSSLTGKRLFGPGGMNLNTLALPEAAQKVMKSISEERKRVLEDIYENKLDVTKMQLSDLDIAYLDILIDISKAQKDIVQPMTQANKSRALSVPGSKSQQTSGTRSSIMTWIGSSQFKRLLTSTHICVTALICMIGKKNIIRIQFFLNIFFFL